MNRGAIILCGGRSSRMARDKACLPFGPHELMLQRVVRLVAGVVPLNQIVCVAGPTQQLPDLPASIQVVRDKQYNQGPLAALAEGLAALHGRTDAAFVTGCDAPGILPEFISQCFELLADRPAAATHDGSKWLPLPAVYRVSLLPHVAELLVRGERSLNAILETVDAIRLQLEELRLVDPALSSLDSCNTPEEYQRALERSGFATSR